MKSHWTRLFVGDQRPDDPAQLTWLQQFYHLAQFTARNFVQNRLPVRAASLSYTTILALVPILAVVVGITSSLLKGESEDRIGQFVEEMVDHLIPPATSTNLAPTAAKGAGDEIFEAGEAAPETTFTASSGLSTEVASDRSTSDAALTQEPEASGLNATNAAGAAEGEQPPEDSEVATAPEDSALNDDARERVVQQIKGFIDNTRSGTLGLTGSVAIIFLAISMLIRIEDAFNDIWGVLKGRTLFMRLVLYWTVISLAPVFVLVCVGLASGPHLAATQQLIGRIPIVGWLLFQLLPILMLVVAFGAFYMLMPNTRVQWRAALVGGVVAALLWHANNSLSVLYVSRVVTNSRIYGSLGLVPVFMIGLYFAWMILLLGGQVSYAWQNRMAYLQERVRVSDNINQRGREFVALRLMTAIGASFQRGAAPPGAGQLAGSLSVPPRVAQEVLATLAGARLLTEVSGPEASFVPARPLETISCHDVLHAMRSTQGTDVATRDEPVQRQIYGEFERINDAERKAAESISMLALAERANSLGAGDPADRRELAAGKTKETT